LRCSGAEAPSRDHGTPATRRASKAAAGARGFLHLNCGCPLSGWARPRARHFVRSACEPPTVPSPNILTSRIKSSELSGSARWLNPARSIRTTTVFHGVSCPTTLTEASSDLHLAYRAKLCCVFRLSQSLDALFRSQPLRPCFMPVAPLGFHFQRLSLSGSGPPSLDGTSPSCRSNGQRVSSARTNPTNPGFKGVRTRKVRTWQAGVTRLLLVDPLVAFYLFEVSPYGLGSVFPRSLLSWAFDVAPGASTQCYVSLSRVSKNRRVASLLREMPPSVRFASSSHSLLPKQE
jgi:hypothetical protein